MKRRFFLKLFVLAFFMGAAIAYGYRDSLIKTGIDHIALPLLQRQLGMKMTIGSVMTDLSGHLSLADIALISPATPEQSGCSLNLQRIDMYFQPHTLLDGFLFFVQQSRVVVDGGQLLLSLAESGEKTGFSMPDTLPLPSEIHLPEITVRDMTVRIDRQSRIFSFDHLLATVRRKTGIKPEYSLHLQSSVFTNKNKSTTLLSGPAALDADFSSTELTINSVTFNGQQILEHADIKRQAESADIFFSGSLHLFGLGSEFSGSLQKDILSLKGTVGLEDPGEAHLLSAQWGITPPEKLSAEVDGHIDLNRPEQSRARLKLLMQDADIKGVAVKDLAVRATVADGICHINQLNLQGRNNYLSGTDLSFPITDLFSDNRMTTLRNGSGAFQLSFSDLPSLARLAGYPQLAKNVSSQSLNLVGRLDRGTLTSQDGRLVIGRNSLDLRSMYLTLPVQADQWSKTGFSLAANFAVPDPATITALFNLPDFHGALSGNIDLSGTPEAPVGVFQLRGEQLRYGDVAAEYLQADGTFKKPSLTISLQAKQVSTKGSPLVFAGKLDADYSPDGLRIQKCDWKEVGSTGSLRIDGLLPLVLHDGIKLLPAPISLNLDVDLADTAIVTAFFPNAIQPDGTIKGQVRLQGTWENPDGRIELQATGLRPSLSMDWLPSAPLALQCSASLSDRKIRLTRLSAASAGVNLELDGSWTFTDSIGSLLLNRQDILSGNLDVGGRMAIADIGWLAGKFPAIRSMAGSCEAELTARGPVDSPALAADLHLSKGSLRFDADFPALRDLDIRAELKPDTLHFSSFEGLLGGSPFHLDGRVLFGKGEEPDLDLTFNGENLLLYRDADLRLRADSSLSLAGPLSRLTLKGKLTVNDSMYTKDVSLLDFTGSEKPMQNGQNGLRLFSIIDQPFADMKLQVSILTGEPFMIRNNLASGGLRSDLLLTGTGRFPELTGVVYLDPVRVGLPAGTLNVESGTIRFPDDNPEFPELDINASSRMMGYDVSVRISGRYDEPEVTLSSSPTLADEELLLMLLAGIRPKSESGSIAARAGGNIALYFSKGVLASWFKNDDEDPAQAFLDRLQVDYGRAVTRQGDSTVEAQLRVADNLFGANDTLYLKTEKDIYDQYNTGVRVVFHFR